MTEKAYIERSEALDAIRHSDSLHSAYIALAKLRYADVRPVVRGHWITEEEAEAKGNYLLQNACSVCGHCDWDNTESKYFNFCPNCGAMMEES